MNLNTMKRLFSFCRPYVHYLYLALIFSACQIVFTLLTPVFIGQAVDQMITKGQVHFDVLFYKMILIALSVLCTAIFDWLVVRISNKMT